MFLIPWSDVSVAVIAMGAGSVGGYLMGIFGRGLKSAVQDMVIDAEPSVAHAVPCAAHIELSVDMKASFSEVFRRLEKNDATILGFAQNFADIRADSAFIKARLDHKNAVTHLRPFVDEVSHPGGVSKEPLLLLVDDRAEAMRPLITMIEEAGFSVSVATDENTARESLGMIPFHYAIIDASLDGFNLESHDGVRLAEWASKSFPALRVFIYSGHDLSTIPAHCRFFNKQDFRLLLAVLREERERHGRS